MRNKHLYPKEWKLLSWQCREDAGWMCEGCGVAQGTERESRRGNLYRVRLAACHMDHNERHLLDAELICLCERCHWHHDFLQWQLDQWRSLEALKHARLITPKRIAQAEAQVKARIRQEKEIMYEEVMVEHGHAASL